MPIVVIMRLLIRSLGLLPALLDVICAINIFRLPLPRHGPIADPDTNERRRIHIDNEWHSDNRWSTKLVDI